MEHVLPNINGAIKMLSLTTRLIYNAAASSYGPTIKCSSHVLQILSYDDY